MRHKAIELFAFAGTLLACSASPDAARSRQVAAPEADGAPAVASTSTTPVPATLPKNAPLDRTLRNIPATTGRANLPATAPPFAMSVLGRFHEPFAMAVMPDDGGILVTEKDGVLKWRKADGQVVTVAGAPRVAQGGQGGLLDVAVAPDFNTSHTIFLSFAEQGPGGSGLALARATFESNAIRCIRAPCPTGGAALQQMKIVWRSGMYGLGGQFGANILFAPDGKSLYFSSGERQRFTPAQDPRQALGKILHLTLDGKAAPGNPMIGRGGTEAMTWSSGHRNPYGMVFAPDGRLWEEEMGPRGGDELNLIRPGRNYGWPIVSNGDNYSGQPIPDHPSRPDLEAPKLWWNPSISPTGMILYSGALFPELKGSLLMTSMSDAGLSRVSIAGDQAKSVSFWDFGSRLRDIAQGAGGEIYVLEDGDDARLLRLDPRH